MTAPFIITTDRHKFASAASNLPNHPSHLFIQDGEECARCANCDCRIVGRWQGLPCDTHEDNFDEVAEPLVRADFAVLDGLVRDGVALAGWQEWRYRDYLEVLG